MTGVLDRTAIRDAATVILLRDSAGPEPKVLMGQRGETAAFMPSKFVFPGGAVDPADSGIPMARPMHGLCRARLTQGAGRVDPMAIVAAGIRELWEETGLIMGQPHRWPGTAPESWQSFASTGHLPAPSGLRFVFRAITPPGRTRRFDARFFVADAARLVGDPDDFSRATDELSHLQWIPLRDARNFDLPFITEVVLAEVTARLPALDAPPSVPFFKNDDEESLFLRLGRGRPGV